MITYRMWIEGDPALENVAPGVFDRPIDPGWSLEFARDPRHHLAIAGDDGVVIGMVSALDYVRPDKPPEMFINEVAIATDYRGRGIGRELLRLMLDHARSLGLREAWLLTDEGNAAARAMYKAAGAQEKPQLLQWFDLES